MVGAIGKGIRRLASALALALSIGTGAVAEGAVAEGAGATAFGWPDNPFAYTLPELIFADTGETRGQKAARVFLDTMGGIGGELGQIASFPLRDPATFGSFALGIGALTLIDKPATTLYQQTLVPIGKAFDLPKFIKLRHTTKDERFLALALAGTYGYGVAANDERAQVAALLTSKAIGYSYLTSHVVLKTAFGRLRPVPDLAGHKGDPYPYSTSPFRFFKSTGPKFSSDPFATGMPSFHFTMYFSTARVYSGVYDNYLVPYGIAAALALQSAEGHNHWVSDMVAGALIGTGIGNVVLKSYEQRRGIGAALMPIASANGAGLGLQMTF